MLDSLLTSCLPAEKVLLQDYRLSYRCTGLTRRDDIFCSHLHLHVVLFINFLQSVYRLRMFVLTLIATSFLNPAMLNGYTLNFNALYSI